MADIPGRDPRLSDMTEERGRFPKVNAAYDVAVCVLGLLFRALCLEAGVPALDDASDLFVVSMYERVR